MESIITPHLVLHFHVPQTLLAGLMLICSQPYPELQLHSPE